MNRVQLGAARNRVRRRIQERLDAQGLNMASLGRKIGVRRQTVFATISGTKHSPTVLEALRELGVPEKYLFDPAKHTNTEGNEEAA